MTYTYRPGRGDADALHRLINGLIAENRDLKARLKGRDETTRYTFPPEQALRIAMHQAAIALRDDPNPHGNFGGPAGLELAAQEAELWDKRHRARAARRKGQSA